MKLSSVRPAGSAYERILATASDLFYQQGYRATGINELIEKSGVAKATFYKHFPTKDALCLVYLQERNQRELAEIRQYAEAMTTPAERFLAPMGSLEPWLLGNGMKGCAFLNMVPEVTDSEDPLRKEGAAHYTRLRVLIGELATELIASEPQRYGHLDAGSLTDDYMVILTGAIALSEITHDIGPVRHGVEAARRLIE